jgi:hypothetical protein
MLSDVTPPTATRQHGESRGRGIPGFLVFRDHA